jgi:hypothetical protein
LPAQSYARNDDGMRDLNDLFLRTAAVAGERFEELEED